MTNLQQDLEQRDIGPSPATLKRLWLWGPIALASAIAGLLLLLLALPQGMALRRDLQRMEELDIHRQERDLLKRQMAKLAQDRKQAERQQKDLIRLVTGKQDPATFLATLDLEALDAKVKLRLFEPVVATPAAGQPQPGGAPPPPPAGGAAPPPGQPPPPGGGGREANPELADPLARAGLQKRNLVLTASGTYPQILDFLRRMERLEVLVEQKDLNLSLAGDGPDRNPRNPDELLPAGSVPEVEVKLGITLYSKERKEPQREKQPAKPAGQPG